MVSVRRFGNRLIADFGHFEWTIQSERGTEWHHMAIVWDGRDMYGYLDGRRSIKGTNRFGKVTADRFQVGDADSSFLGAIDDIRVCDRALSAKEVQALVFEPF